MHEKRRYVKLKSTGSATRLPSRFSTGCTECCGNVDYSTSANSDLFCSMTPCTMSGQAVGFFLHRARRESRTKQYRVVVRGGSQEPQRKVSRCRGRNRDRLGDFFWSNARASRPLPSHLGSPRCFILPVRRA